MDLLGMLPFEVGCLILQRVSAPSAVALTRVNRTMRRLVAASGYYDPGKHTRVGHVEIRSEADLQALRGVRVLVGSIEFKRACATLQQGDVPWPTRSLQRYSAAAGVRGIRHPA
jgi:hypothetical protein